MAEQLLSLVVAGLLGLLILLRLDAARFGAADYDDATANAGWRGALRRLSWYLVGVVLAVGIYELHPSPVSTLHLSTGPDRLGMLLLGLLAGALGTTAAIGAAWFRYLRFRLPEYRHYPGAAINAIGTAFVDEVTFRGVLVGLTLAAGWPADLAVAFQAVLYALVTRLGAPGRSHVMLLISLIVGAVAALLTIATGGIGAGLLAHAIIRFGVFVTTGHAGQVPPSGRELEERAAQQLPPDGWQVVPEEDS